MIYNLNEEYEENNDTVIDDLREAAITVLEYCEYLEEVSMKDGIKHIANKSADTVKGLANKSGQWVADNVKNAKEYIKDPELRKTYKDIKKDKERLIKNIILTTDDSADAVKELNKANQYTSFNRFKRTPEYAKYRYYKDHDDKYKKSIKESVEMVYNFLNELED